MLKLGNINVAKLYHNRKAISKAFLGRSLVWQSSSEYWGLCFTAEEAGAVVSMTKTSVAPAVSLESSRDGVTWTTFDADGGTTPITLTNVGDKVYFRAGSGGNNRLASSPSQYHTFTLTKRAKASGNIMSLLDGSTEMTEFITGSYHFTSLFHGCASLTQAPELPATTAMGYCYSSMFSGCTSLTQAPELPATSVETYSYEQMFSGCTSLTSMPELPATTLGSSCYRQMFSGCTSLTQVYELPANTVESNSYRQMFSGCTSLTQAPEIKGILNKSRAFQQMFERCSQLTSIKVAFTSWSSNYTSNWVNGVSSSGTFYCPTALGTNSAITRGTSNCPTGWTVVNTD